jgi:uncharacterized membrane protein (DUF485 family)
MSSTVVDREVVDGDIDIDTDADAVAKRRIRVVLSASALVVVAVMALPILTSFTHILDGVVAGIGVAYIVGFGEFVFAMAGAVAYCRWVDRLEDGRAGGEGAR